MPSENEYSGIWRFQCIFTNRKLLVHCVQTRQKRLPSTPKHHNNHSEFIHKQIETVFRVYVAWARVFISSQSLSLSASILVCWGLILHVLSPLFTHSIRRENHTRIQAISIRFACIFTNLYVRIGIIQMEYYSVGMAGELNWMIFSPEKCSIRCEYDFQLVRLFVH